MKYFLLFIFTLLCISSNAQKYALIDKRLATPITFAEHVTSTDKFKGLFPVEKKYMAEFIKYLEEISKKLSAKGSLGEAKQYQVGCTKFIGLTVTQAAGDRLDYVLTSNCDNLKISLHLSDAKFSNASNAFFINTLIKYIKDTPTK